MTKRAGGPNPVWTREKVDQFLRDYARLYGPDFTSAAFNPATAAWRDRGDLRERYYEGNPLRGGHAWPSLNQIKALHDGSFNAARESIGLEANRPGPGKAGKRAAGKHRPLPRHTERVRIVRVAASGGASVPPGQIPAADPGQVARLRKQATRAEQRAAVAAERLREARARLKAARDKAGRLEAALARVSEREHALAERLRDEGSHAGVMRRSAGALQARVESLEAEVASRAKNQRVLERQLAEARSRIDQDDSRIVKMREALADAEATLELADERELARARDEVQSARARVGGFRAAAQEAEHQVLVERRARQAAERRAERAEQEAAREAGQRKRVQMAVAGHARPLSPAQIEALREQGPQGWAVFREAASDVVKAHGKGQRERLKLALHRVASAAVSWAERL